jgi:hypothetical protein
MHRIFFKCTYQSEENYCSKQKQACPAKIIFYVIAKVANLLIIAKKKTDRKYRMILRNFDLRDRGRRNRTSVRMIFSIPQKKLT